MNAPVNFVSIQGLGSVGADNLNTLLQWCSNVAQAREFIALPGMILVVEGTTTPNDGGQGFFYWNANATASDDNGVSTIVPLGAGASGAWTRFGATQFLPCVTILTPSGGDDGPAISSATGTILLGCGPFQIQSNTATSQNVIVLPGTTFNITTGKTLAFNGGFAAQPSQPLFTNALSGQGTVTFGPGLITGYPEWWGAKPNTPTFDCSGAINACVVACPVTQLAQAQYYIANTVFVGITGKTFQGTNANQSNLGYANGSWLMNTSGSNSAMIVGLNQTLQPPVNNYILGIRLRDFSIARTATIQNPASGVLPCPCGIQFKWIGLGIFTNVLVQDNSIGFYIGGAVDCYWERCTSFRFTAGANTSNDNYSGFYLDYTLPVVGYNGAIASGYIKECRLACTTTNPLTYSAGITSAGGYVDLFITRCETSSSGPGIMQYGIDLEGGSPPMTFGTEDTLLSQCILDQCSIACININNGSAYSGIKIEGCYGAINETSSIGISVQNVPGVVTVANNQIISAGIGIGMAFNACSGFTTTGNAFNNTPIGISITSCNAFRCQGDVIRQVTAASSPAVRVITSREGFIAPTVWTPTTGYYSFGVSIDGSGSQGICVDPSGIDPRCFSGGAADYIGYGGSPWGGGATFGTRNYAIGKIT